MDSASPARNALCVLPSSGSPHTAAPASDSQQDCQAEGLTVLAANPVLRSAALSCRHTAVKPDGRAIVGTCISEQCPLTHHFSASEHLPWSQPDWARAPCTHGLQLAPSAFPASGYHSCPRMQLRPNALLVPQCAAANQSPNATNNRSELIGKQRWIAAITMHRPTAQTNNPHTV